MQNVQVIVEQLKKEAPNIAKAVEEKLENQMRHVRTGMLTA